MSDFLFLRDFKDNLVTFKKHSTRVKLMNTQYSARDNNPVVWSTFECEGTVVGLDKYAISHPIKVSWDNGTTNNYFGHDLIKVGEIEINSNSNLNPNRAFRLKQEKCRKSREELSKQKEVGF